MVKEIKKTDIPCAEKPRKGTIEEFVIDKIQEGELQEFVDPKIITDKFKNATLADPYFKVYSKNAKWGNASELIAIPDIVTYRCKIDKIQQQYGELVIGLSLKYIFDGENWNLVLP